MINKEIRLIFILVATVAFATFHTACDRNKEERYDERLAYVDSLCNVSPQEARKYLDKFPIAYFKDVDTVYYRFLCIKIDTKLGKMPDSDRHVLNVIKGFGSLDDKRLLGEAYFYAGVTYRRLGNYSEAMECLNAADDLTKDMSDLRLRSYIHSQKGNVLISLGLMDMSIMAYKESLRMDCVRKDTADIILCYRNLAYAYDKTNDKRMCLETMKRAIILAQKAGLNDEENNVRVQFAGIYANNKQFKKAAEILSGCCISRNSPDYAPYLNICAKIFKGQAKLDSLFYCSQQMMKYGWIDDRVFACRNLTDVFLNRHMVDSAAKYMNIHDALFDSLNHMNTLDITAKMNAAYNYREKCRELEASKVASLRRTIALISAICVLLFVTGSVVLMLKEKNRRQLKLVTELQCRILNKTDEVMDKKQHEIDELEKIEKALIADKCKNDELDRIRDYKALLLDDKAVADYEKRKDTEIMERISGSAVYNKFCESISDGKKMTDGDWDELDLLVNNEFPRFRERLELLSDISSQEYKTCLLVKVGFSSSKIARLTFRSRSSISMLRKRLAEKMFGEGCSAAELDEYIKAL